MGWARSGSPPTARIAFGWIDGDLTMAGGLTAARLFFVLWWCSTCGGSGESGRKRKPWLHLLDEIEPLKQAALAALRGGKRPASPGTGQGRVSGRRRSVHRAHEAARHAGQGGTTRRGQGHQRRQGGDRGRARGLPRGPGIARGGIAQGSHRFHRARAPTIPGPPASADPGHGRHRARVSPIGLRGGGWS
jgi:hypothetical protein